MDRGRSTTDSNKKLIGVAITDFTDDGLTALKWASEFLRQPNTNYELCVILIKIVTNGDPHNVSSHTWDEIERVFKNDAGESGIDKFQGLAMVFDTKKMRLKTFTGTYIQEALQHAIEKLGIDTLVVGGPRIVQSQIELELSGCSIVHVMKTDTRARTTLSLLPAAPRAIVHPPAAAHPSHQPQFSTQSERGAAGGQQVRTETSIGRSRNAQS